ncbi:MAG: phosphonate ABC transporter, permease protein PhnE [Microbacteriaceae bacterium]
MSTTLLAPEKPGGPILRMLTRVVPTIIIFVVVVWAFTGIDFKGLGKTAGTVTAAMFKGFLNPDTSFVWNGTGEDLIGLMILTIAIALIGTIIAVIGAIPLAFIMAAGPHKPKVVSGLAQFALTVLRTFPEIVLAVIFVKMVGPGPFAGAMAIGVHSVGMLGKLYSEEIEKIPKQPIEGLVAVGGNALQTLWYAKLPLLIPQFLSLALNRFEIAVRSATILGIVGAGGIGTPIIFAIASRNWSRVGIILIGIVITVTLIDMGSGYLRKKLR